MRKLETVVDLLEALREEKGWDSDGEIARQLRVPQPTVSTWRIGTRTPGDEHALKIAEALNTSPLLVIAIAAAERAKSVQSKRIWRKVAEDVAEQVARRALPVFAALAMAAGGSTPPAQADAPAMYITSNRRRKVRAASEPIAAQQI